MPNIAEIAAMMQAMEAKERSEQHTTLCVYGDPKSGKTRLMATLARIPEVRRIWWFDLENGAETLVTMMMKGELTQEEAAKINLIRVVDLPESPVGIDTILKCLVVQKPVNLCIIHGRVECPTCKLVETQQKIKLQWQRFALQELTRDDWVVIDSGSQVGVSALNYATKGMGYNEKPGFDEYGMVSRMLSDIFTTVQAAPFCNYAVITHQLMLEEKDVEKKMATETTVDATFGKIYPLIGSKNFSISCAKYFGTIIYTEKVLRNHRAGSSSTYKSDVIAGSRMGMRIEDEKDMDMRLVFSKLGLTAWKPTPSAETNIKK